MKRTTRFTAGLVAAAALTAPSAQATAVAVPPTTHAHAQTKQLLKDIAGKDARLARLSTSAALARLSDDTEAALVANIDAARTTLSDIKMSVEAVDSTVDTRAERKELRAFRVENFRIVVNLLTRAEEVEETAAADPVTLAALAAVETAALEIDATSTKADIRAVRDQVNAAQGTTEVEVETD